MPLQTKIVLSDKELALIKNVDWILTKHEIIKKVYSLFNDCIPWIDDAMKGINDINAEAPKISRGENYLGLPYVTLDHPRNFGKTDTFALRTMFWWGNFISITLHTSGAYSGRIRAQLLSEKLPSQLYICIHEEQWHHHFENDNYQKADSVKDLENIIRNKDFIKIAFRYELDDLNNMPALLAEGYHSIRRLIS